MRAAMSPTRFLTFSYSFKARVHLKLVAIRGFNQKCLVGWGRTEQQHFHMTSALNELQVISVSDTCRTVHALFSSLVLQDTFVFLKIYAQHVRWSASHRKTGRAKLNSRSTLIANWQSCWYDCARKARSLCTWPEVPDNTFCFDLCPPQLHY